MRNPFKKNIQKESSVQKTFSFSLGEVKLQFALRIDIKGQLKDFLQCLKTAQIEVEEELKKL